MGRLWKTKLALTFLCSMVFLSACTQSSHLSSLNDTQPRDEKKGVISLGARVEITQAAKVDSNTATIGNAVPVTDSFYDLGESLVGAPQQIVLTLKNTGATEAKDLTPQMLPLHFQFTGQNNQYPGEKGTCGKTLAPGQECRLALTFSPVDAATVRRPLSLNFQDQAGNKSSSLILLATGLVPPGLNGGVTSLAWAGGKPGNAFYVGGTFTHYNGALTPKFARLTPHGSLECRATDGFDGGILALKAIPNDPQERVYAVGLFKIFNRTGSAPIHVNRIARLTKNCQLDTSFVTKTGFNRATRTLALDEEGKVYVAGDFQKYQGTLHPYLVRLLPSGTLDTNFRPTEAVNGAVKHVVFDPGLNKLYVVGNFRYPNGLFLNSSRIPAALVLRLNIDGSLDSSFSTHGLFPDAMSPPLKAMPLPGGEVLISGAFRERILKLDESGKPKFGFSGPGELLDNAVLDIGLETTTNKFYAVGAFTKVGDHLSRQIARFSLQTGALDPSFKVEWANSRIASLLLFNTPAEGILIGGNFYNVTSKGKNQAVMRIAKLDENGNLDEAFSKAGGFSYGYTSSIAVVRSSGTTRIFVGGAIQGGLANFDANTETPLLKSSSFSTHGGFDGFVNTVISATHPLDVGKIYVGGSFTAYKNQLARRLIRLKLDTKVDPDFAIGTGFNGRVEALAEGKEKKLYVGGAFTQFNGGPARGLVRLDRRGIRDSQFELKGGFEGGIVTLILPVTHRQGEESIWVGGTFTRYQGKPIGQLIRLKEDGSIDENVHGPKGQISLGLNAAPLALAAEDGISDKIYVGGRFTTCRGKHVDYLVRLNGNGDIDPSFQTGSETNPGFNTTVAALWVSSSGDLYVGGGFVRYKGSNTIKLAKLKPNGDLIPFLGSSALETSSFVTGIFPLPGSDDDFIITGDLTHYSYDDQTTQSHVEAALNGFATFSGNALLQNVQYAEDIN